MSAKAKGITLAPTSPHTEADVLNSREGTQLSSSEEDSDNEDSSHESATDQPPSTDSERGPEAPSFRGYTKESFVQYNAADISRRLKKVRNARTDSQASHLVHAIREMCKKNRNLEYLLKTDDKHLTHTWKRLSLALSSMVRDKLSLFLQSDCDIEGCITIKTMHERIAEFAPPFCGIGSLPKFGLWTRRTPQESFFGFKLRIAYTLDALEHEGVPDQPGVARLIACCIWNSHFPHYFEEVMSIRTPYRKAFREFKRISDVVQWFSEKDALEAPKIEYDESHDFKQRGKGKKRKRQRN